MSSTVHHLNTEITPRRMEPVHAAPPPPDQHDILSDDPERQDTETTAHDDSHATEPALSGPASLLTPFISRYEALTPRQKLYGGSGLGICAVLLAGILATSGHHHHAVSAPGQEVGMDQTAAPMAQAPEPAPSAPPHASADLAEMQTLGHPKAAATPPASAPAPKAAPAAIVVTPPAPPQSAPPQTDAPAVAPAAPPADPVQAAHTLQAAPMATQQQIDVLQLVTAEARVIERERGEVEELRQSLAGQRKAEEDRLNDLTRRISLVEASHAVTGAENSGADEAAQAHAAAEKARAALSAAMNGPASKAPALSSSSAPPAPAAVAAPAPKPAWVHHYRIVAASPQLAMIEDSAAPSGQDRQFEVGVGTVIPGYGAVLTISQQGATWVLHTAHGDLN
ncbi:hypothetical protein JK176_12950 [Gluconobacter sp. Dm-73]|uniref:hypothetical protein n=1 Tax=Gluconobacter sp. Dm-73 TaxID=2799802 RepID=UPI001B8D7A92|nr:hypothetical protein [Gluconobacter sp. Dm-73]MBS1075788.1 hypothetical protein [Gluconobacter sp. Dm-73]